MSDITLFHLEPKVKMEEAIISAIISGFWVTTVQIWRRIEP